MDTPSFFPGSWEKTKKTETSQPTREGELRSFVSDIIAKIKNAPSPEKGGRRDYTREIDLR
ncbi:MAG: hypothetical protein HZA36_02365, partial [Parcubacteria group bacterium]|nr:hypothetical protein [Parcubacteria group bacterium]